MTDSLSEADRDDMASAHDLYLDQIDPPRAKRLAAILRATGRYGDEAIAVVADVLAAEMIDEARTR